MSGCVIVSFCNHGFTPIKQTTLNSQTQLMSSACEKSAKLRRRPPRRIALSIAVTPSISLTTRWQGLYEKLRVPFNWHSFQLANCLCSSPESLPRV
jgi:hypothetical protein